MLHHSRPLKGATLPSLHHLRPALSIKQFSINTKMSATPITVVLCGGRIGNKEPFTASTKLEEAFKILAAHNVKNIDSAQLYGESQATIGEVKAGDRFIIDTKWGPVGLFGPGAPQGGPPGGWASKEKIVSSAKASIENLGVKQVWI